MRIPPSVRPRTPSKSAYSPKRFLPAAEPNSAVARPAGRKPFHGPYGGWVGRGMNVKKTKLHKKFRLVFGVVLGVFLVKRLTKTSINFQRSFTKKTNKFSPKTARKLDVFLVRIW
jgi:hypothetical protein